ncbi:hypothetical protein [Acinetobacter sp.]|uniref:hypothetical protein n=1 Tax=Acinetobacter sp. TaxID=472 RepID=UPI0035B3B6FA
MNHIANHFMQSNSHSISSYYANSNQIMSLSQRQLSQLGLHQQQLLQVLAYGTSKAFCLNILRVKQIDFLNLGSVVYCANLNLLLQFRARRLVGFQILKFDVNSTS